MDVCHQANTICEKAIRTGVHPGYSTWFVKDTSTYLYNVQASVEFEMTSPDSSLALHMKIRDIREANKRAGNSADEMWIGAANGNIAVSLLGENRPAEALDILQTLIERDDLISQRDNYFLNNISLALRLLGRLDEAVNLSEQAQAAIQKLHGEASVPMAL